MFAEELIPGIACLLTWTIHDLVRLLSTFQLAIVQRYYSVGRETNADLLQELYNDKAGAGSSSR